MKVSNLIKKIEGRYPLFSSMSFDNSGASVLFDESEVTGVLICVDCSMEAINFAIENNLNLIISHHPLIFYPIKSITNDIISERIKLLIKNNISSYSCHTNFDVHLTYGMGKILTDLIFSKNQIVKNSILEEIYVNNKKFGLGNVLKLKKGLTIDELVDLFISKLDLDKSKINYYYKDKNKKNSTIVVLPGSGSSEVEKVMKIKPDVLITSELKHNQIQELLDCDISYFNATHYGLEKCFIEYMYKFIKSNKSLKALKFYDKYL